MFGNNEVWLNLLKFPREEEKRDMKPWH